MAKMYTARLLGKCTGLLALGILTTSLLAQVRVSAIVASCAFVDALLLALPLYNTIYLARLVFETHGKGHYVLTLWRIIDALLANMLLNHAVNLMLWKFGVAFTTDTLYSHTSPTRHSLYALYDLGVYSFLLSNGGGIIDNVPLAEAARAFAALLSAWNYVFLLIVFSAAVATLQMHRDEALTH